MLALVAEGEPGMDFIERIVGIAPDNGTRAFECLLTLLLASLGLFYALNKVRFLAGIGRMRFLVNLRTGKRSTHPAKLR